MRTTIDEAQLTRIAKIRRFDRRTLEIAHRLFIAKDRPLQLAAEYGVRHQRVYSIRRAVLEEALPQGEAEVTLRGPAAAVEAAKREFERYMGRTGSTGT